MNDCIFCKIINRQAPGYIIAENADVIIFVSRHNHPLVVPKRHVRDIYELDDRTGHHVMDSMIRTAKAVKHGLECDGIYITQANEPAAGQDVFHLHFHIYPRWRGEAKSYSKPASDTEREETAERIRAVYGKR